MSDEMTTETTVDQDELVESPVDETDDDPVDDGGRRRDHG